MEEEHARHNNESDLNDQLRRSSTWNDVPVSLPTDDVQPSQPFMHHHHQQHHQQQQHPQRPILINDEDLYRIVGATFPQQQQDLQFDQPIDPQPPHHQLSRPVTQDVHLQQAHVTPPGAPHFAPPREQLHAAAPPHNMSQPFADTFLPPACTPHQSLPLPVSTAPASLATTESAIPQHPPPASPFKAPLASSSPQQQQPTPFPLQQQIPVPPPPPAPDAADTPVKFRPQQRRRSSVLRSAVEEARLSAQREAETFAHSRRDTWRRDNTNTKTLSGGSNSSATHDGSSEKHSIKRSRSGGTGGDAGGGGDNNNINDNNNNNNNNNQKLGTGSVVGGGGGGGGGGDEMEKDSKERENYQRRLDMNRKSAAVSRVKRRAYVRELEERLAAVEAEKLQMENKLEFLQAQNLSYRKQMDNLFIMLASGRRLSFSPTSQQQLQPPLPPSPPPAPSSEPTPPHQYGMTAQHDNVNHPSGLISHHHHHHQQQQQQQCIRQHEPQLSLPLSTVEDIAYATNTHLDIQQAPPVPAPTATASVLPIHSQAFMQSGGMASNNP